MDDMRNTSAPLYGKAEPATTKTTMSVREMRQLLGLGKTDSYWLLHKNLFEVILINDKRRIVISSFEKWYTNQVKYHKVNGSPPGEELCKRSYSVPDAAEILKVKPETIYTLIRQGKLKTETTDFCMRIPKEEFERWYGVNTWAMSTYESRRGLARNYITPIIGDMLLSDITPRMMDKYYRDLLSVKTVSVNNRKPTSEYLTPHTVREIHKLLRSAFNQAVRWELISRNPVLNATLPKEEHKERDIWTAETLSKAMEVCDDPILSLALNLAFSCSLRIGEMLGLTWDCIDIAPQSIENGSAYIFVNKELQRVTRGALDDLSDKGVIKKFPPCIASTHTALVLKEPMQINGNIVVLPVPAEKQDLAYLPDRFETGERIQTPRGSFQVTAMSREQMEAAGYGVHHISDDGKYLTRLRVAPLLPGRR